MALKKCKECGGKVSKKADTCPHCGYKRNGGGFLGSIARGVGGCLTMIFFMFLLYTCITSIEIPVDDTPWDQKNDYIGAYLMTQEWVKERLKSPGTAEFPGVGTYKNHVEWYEDQKYVINSYVDSQNSFGGMVRTNFRAEVQQTGKDEWKLLELNLE